MLISLPNNFSNVSAVLTLFYKQTHLMNWSSPEVVEKDVGDGRLRSKISVLLNGTDVVEHEAAIQAVVVDQDASQDEDGAQTAARRLRRFLRYVAVTTETPSTPTSPRPHRRHHSTKPTHPTYAVHRDLPTPDQIFKPLTLPSSLPQNPSHKQTRTSSNLKCFARSQRKHDHEQNWDYKFRYRNRGAKTGENSKNALFNTKNATVHLVFRLVRSTCHCFFSKSSHLTFM